MFELRVVLVFLVLVSCSSPVLHIHDRHVLSAAPVVAFTSNHPGATLLLIDYHHDAGNPNGNLTSYNWVGQLIMEGRLDHVVWVSARRFTVGQRESRRAWLIRSLADTLPKVVDRIVGSYQIFDGADLAKWVPSGPLVVSLDLDVLAHDSGPDPEAFLQELIREVSAEKPELVTVALSAAYQLDPDRAWGWLATWLTSPFTRESEVVLEGGDFAPSIESNEEENAWKLWKHEPVRFQSSSLGAFWPGAGIWFGAPAPVRRSLLALRAKGGDDSGRSALAAWADPARSTLESSFPNERLHSCLRQARGAVTAALNSVIPSEPTADPQVDLGIAVRVLNLGTDRGCLAWYRGVKETGPVVDWCAWQAVRDPRYSPVALSESPYLSVEISVFGPWSDMSSPKDFSPGFDSLLLLDGHETTLLQASLAVERHYDRETFLSRISAKAGLGPEGWKKSGIRFRRAPTLWALEPLVQVDGVQKNEKK